MSREERKKEGERHREKDSASRMATMEGKEFGDTDMILLDKVTEEAANANLKLRFERGKVRESHSSGKAESPHQRLCYKCHRLSPPIKDYATNATIFRNLAKNSQESGKE